MIYPFSRKPDRIILFENNRNVAVDRTRPLLDADLGLALWKDRRVAPMVKLASLSLGVLATAGVVVADLFLARIMMGAHVRGPVPISSLAIGGGSLLFGTIALLRLAPANIVKIVRLERGGAIPLRVRRR